MDTLERATHVADQIEAQLKHLHPSERLAGTALYLGRETQRFGAPVSLAMEDVLALIELSHAASLVAGSSEALREGLEAETLRERAAK